MGFSFGIRKLSRCQSQEGEDCHGVLGFHLRLGDEDQDLVICQDVENSVPNLIHPSLHVQEEKTETIPLLVSRSFWRTHWMIHDDSVSNNINNGQKVHPISSAGEAAPKLWRRRTKRCRALDSGCRNRTAWGGISAILCKSPVLLISFPSIFSIVGCSSFFGLIVSAIWTGSRDFSYWKLEPVGLY